MKTYLSIARLLWNNSQINRKYSRLPEQLQRAMAAEAEAAREARAKIVRANGEQKATNALKEAANVLAESPSALQLRYLQTLSSIGNEKNTTIIFPVPIDILSHFSRPRSKPKSVKKSPVAKKDPADVKGGGLDGSLDRKALKAGESMTGTTHGSQQRGIDYPDSGTKAGRGGSLQLQISPSAPPSGNHDRGRRPSLSQIANFQKQHTIEDDGEDDFDEKKTLISPTNKATKQSPGADYCDTLGLFSGLRQDYAWCADSPTSPKERIIHDELYSTAASSTKKTKQPPEPPKLSLPVRETGSSPTMHSLSPSSALGPSSSRSRSWPKEQQASKNLAMAGRLQSKDLLDHEWVDFQGKIQSWSKEDSGPSLEEDEKLKSKDLLDTEWIDFQHNIQDPPQAPKRKQSLLIGPDDGYESSTNLKSRTMSSTSSLVQRRASPTAATNVRQMNIIKEDKEENHVRKEQ